jgi:thiamine biosynthesis protein ThiS
MKIYINNEIQEFEEGISLELVLEQHQLTAKNGIAVAVNEEIIPKKNGNKQDYLIAIKSSLLVL